MPPARTMRPLYVDRLPPCNHACPAGENIQAWLSEAQAGRYRKAWEIIVRDNPLPAVHGRVCYHPCEDACNRGELDEPVSIHAVERFLGDLALEEGWTIAPTSRRRASACSSSAPDRAASPQPGTWHCAATRRGLRRRTARRRHDALRNPEVPPAARGARRRSRAHRRDGRADRAESQGHRSRRREDRRPIRCRIPGDRRAPEQAAGDPRARRREDLRRARTSSRTWSAAASHRDSVDASPSTAGATRRWTPPAPPGGSEPNR